MGHFSFICDECGYEHPSADEDDTVGINFTELDIYVDSFDYPTPVLVKGPFKVLGPKEADPALVAALADTAVFVGHYSMYGKVYSKSPTIKALNVGIVEFYPKQFEKYFKDWDAGHPEPEDNCWHVQCEQILCHGCFKKVPDGDDKAIAAHNADEAMEKMNLDKFRQLKAYAQGCINDSKKDLSKIRARLPERLRKKDDSDSDEEEDDDEEDEKEDEEEDEVEEDEEEDEEEDDHISKKAKC